MPKFWKKNIFCFCKTLVGIFSAVTGYPRYYKSILDVVGGSKKPIFSNKKDILIRLKNLPIVHVVPTEVESTVQHWFGNSLPQRAEIQGPLVGRGGIARVTCSRESAVPSQHNLWKQFGQIGYLNTS